MSSTTLSTTAKLELEKIKQAEAIRKEKMIAKFYASISFHARSKFDEFFSQVDINHSDERRTLPICAAITNNNDWAFDAILRHPQVDIKRMNPSKVTPIIVAAAHGNERYVRSLLDAGVDARTYCGKTTVSAAIGYLSSYSVLENSDWNLEGESGADAALKKDLQDFFYKRGKYKEQKIGTSIPFSTTTKTLHAHYRGNVDVIGLLLSNGAQPTIPDSGTQRTPIKIVQNPEQFTEFFRALVTCQLQFLSNEGNGVLKFKMKLQNFSQDAPIDIIVHYDLKPSRELILGAIAANANSASAVEALNKKLEDDLHIHSQTQQKKLDELRHQTSPAILEQMKKTRLAAEQQAIDAIPIARAFRTSFNAKLRGAIQGSVVLGGGNVERAKNTLGDYTAKAITSVTDNVPFISALGLKTVGTVIAAGIQALADWNEQKKHKQIARFFDNTAEQEDLAQELAIEMTKHCSFIKEQNLISPSDAEDLGEKLAVAAYLVILSPDPTNKSKANIKQIMFDELSKNKIVENLILAREKRVKQLAVSAPKSTAIVVTAYKAANGAKYSPPSSTNSDSNTNSDSPSSSPEASVSPIAAASTPALVREADKKGCVCM